MEKVQKQQPDMYAGSQKQTMQRNEIHLRISV